jgi:hypothetical protein
VPEGDLGRLSRVPPSRPVGVRTTAGLGGSSGAYKQYCTVVHFGVGVGSNVVFRALDSIVIDWEELGGCIASATEVLEGKAELGQDVIVIGAKGNDAEDEAVNKTESDPGRVR